MLFTTFSVEKSLLYYKGGEFSAHNSWCHRRMFHKGDYELILCLKGPIYLQVGDKQLTLQANEIAIIPPFTQMFGYRDSTSPVDFYWLHFFSQTKESIFEADEAAMLSEIKTNKNSKHRLSLPLHFELRDYEGATILIHQILSIHNELSSIEERDYLVSALLIQLYKSYFNRLDVQGNSSKIDDMKEWIRANMASDLTVAKIATNMHLNVDYLTRLFKKCTGMTTLQYLNHVKIEVAILLLIRTEMPIKQVADAAYFNDPKVFMHRFKSSTGLSPSEYRKAYNLIHLNNPHVDPQIPIPKRIADSIDYIPENGNVPE
ncbi:MAG TPA: AraC family transcriptional regulator [Candidatus Levilactobacillus faecigallinarum]|uniref:AraC family transcriptional regulator n=1 Tax=Candidatus Levilactobacillus faecigallinarum TaxID=2838638 RepID=A0A9D1QQL6_9LACO|nr:AraC family transcriptional regulator [Candidatus Levilactobacillus faecigallinarum]